MDGCGCDGLATTFDRGVADDDREHFRRDGPDRTTRLLLDLIRPYGVGAKTILDIGGGIGVIDCELLAAGAGHAVLVEASHPYLEVARQVAREANLLDRLEFVEGDFVRHAAELDDADIVTLDRCLCCYADAPALVSASAERAQLVYGLVLPRDHWLVRTALRLAIAGSVDEAAGSMPTRTRRSTHGSRRRASRDVQRPAPTSGGWSCMTGWLLPARRKDLRGLVRLKRRLELGYIGSGNALVFNNRGVVKARWSKASNSAPTLLTYASGPNAGQPVPLVRGQIFFQVVSTSTKIRYTIGGMVATASVGPRPV